MRRPRLNFAFALSGHFGPSFRSGFWRSAALLGALLGPARAFAQQPGAPVAPAPPPPTDQAVEKINNNAVYTYVEGMPQLPGGGGNAAVVRAIQRQLKYPAEALRQHITGSVLVNFTVDEKGAVRDGKIVRGLGGGCNEAVLAAVRQLPRFTPGTHKGRPVSASFTVPITFQLAGAGTSSADTLKTNDAPSRVYTVVDDMPELPGGGGKEAISKAIYHELRYPEYALRQGIQGIVIVNFVVDKQGNVRNSRILRGIGGGCDEELLRAVQLLPRFIPGTQAGQPVNVALTVSITFHIEGSANKDLLDTLRTVYPLVDQMPHLPEGGGSPAIFRAVQRAVVMPPEVANDTVACKVFVGFIVGPSGVIRDVKIVRSLNPSCDAAALAAVRKLPRFVGGRLHGLPTSVSFTVPVLFGRLPAQR